MLYHLCVVLHALNIACLMQRVHFSLQFFVYIVTDSNYDMFCASFLLRVYVLFVRDVLAPVVACTGFA